MKQIIGEIREIDSSENMLRKLSRVIGGALIFLRAFFVEVRTLVDRTTACCLSDSFSRNRAYLGF